MYLDFRMIIETEHCYEREPSSTRRLVGIFLFSCSLSHIIDLDGFQIFMAILKKKMPSGLQKIFSPREREKRMIVFLSSVS